MTRHCDRPACPDRAAVTLRFRYADRAATLEPLAPDAPPQTYDLCLAHASRTRPPHGWTLRDLRPDDPQGTASAAVPAGSRDGNGSGVGASFAGRDTVALLAAALHSAADRGVASGASLVAGGDVRRRA